MLDIFCEWQWNIDGVCTDTIRTRIPYLKALIGTGLVFELR